jgi:hypothetical protein
MPRPKKKSIRTSFLRKKKFQVEISCPVEAPVENEYLPEDYEPSSKVVICGRGKAAVKHVGNRRYHIVIAMNVSNYMNAKSKPEKTHLVNAIVANIKASSPAQTGFVKQDPKTKRWIALGDEEAREKVGHALRDAVARHLSDAQKRKDRALFTPSPVSSSSRMEAFLLAQQSIFQDYFMVNEDEAPSRNPMVANTFVGKAA